MKSKTCEHEGCNNPVWSKGFCKWHVPKKRQQKGKSAKPLKRTPLKKVSGKRQKQLAAYSTLRQTYLEQHPNCEICGKPNPTDIHHKSGRSEEKLNDFTNVMALCRQCHNKIHFVSPQWARENGYLE